MDNQERPGRIVSIYGSRRQTAGAASVKSILDCILAEGYILRIERKLAGYLERENIFPDERAGIADQFPEDSALVVSLGGDGTFLRAAQWVGDKETPILGINTGHLGFLSSLSPSDTEELANVLRGEDAMLERRMLLKLECDGMPGDMWPYALNEMALMKADTSSMITVHAAINGDFLADYMTDGLLVSTPTGSTAYNLSVGGPLMQPTLNSFVISPVAPHSLTMRPLVVEGSSNLSFRVSSRADVYRVSLDGRSFLMGCGMTLRVSAAPFKVCVLRLKKDTFPSLLRGKLLWGQR